MSTATLISISGLVLGIVGLILSRIVTRRVRVRVHRAMFIEPSGIGEECYFVNVTNVSLNRAVEITHVWFEVPGMVSVLRKERPLPKRLKADETWETWIEAVKLPVEHTDIDVFRMGRVRLSTGKVVKSKRNKQVPSLGFVPGGGSPPAVTGTIIAPNERLTEHPPSRGPGGGVWGFPIGESEPRTGFPQIEGSVVESIPESHKEVQNASRHETDTFFIRKMLWKPDVWIYRCSICEFDNQDRRVVEEHTRANHGVAVGEDTYPNVLNLVITNVSSSVPLTNCSLTLLDIKRWSAELRHFHTAYEMRQFRPLSLYGDDSTIYVDKPVRFQFLDARARSAPVVHGIVDSSSSDLRLPGQGEWKAEFELQIRGKNPIHFAKCVKWDGASCPVFVSCQ